MKRLFALLIAFALLLCAAPPAFAADGAVYLRSAEDLRALAKNCAVDSYSAGKTFVLAADIDLGGEEFSPIPVFAGIFDGGGRTVRGLKLDAAASVTGLFRCLTDGALVERLFVEGEVCPAGEAQTVGGIAGECRGTIRGCGFTGTVRGSRSVGGVAGRSTAGSLIENCTVAGLVSGEHAVGGVVGACEGSVRSCISYASVGTEEREEELTPSLDLSLAQQTLDISRAGELTDVSREAEELMGVTDVGGVAGWCSGELRGCANAGEVGYPHIGRNIGGVVGRLSGAAYDCSNRGAVCGRKDVGGVVGQLTPAAGWSFSGTKLDELRSLLAQMRQATDRLLADTGAQNAAVSASLYAALQSLNETSEAAQALGDEARGWLDGNLAAANELSARLTQLTDGLVPVFDALRDCTAELPKLVQDLRDAEDALYRASVSASSLPYSVQAARLDLDTTLRQAQLSAAELSSSAAQLRTGLGDPAAHGAAIGQLSAGLGDLSTLFGRVAEDIQLISDALDDLDAGGDASEQLAQLRANLKRMPSSFTQAASAISQLAGGLSAFGGELDAAALSRSLSDLSAGLGDLGVALGSARSVLADVASASAALSAAKPELSNAAREMESAAISAQNALSALDKSVQAAYRLLDGMRGQPSVQFELAGGASENEQALFRSLRDTNAALTSLAGQLQGTALLADVQSASDSLFALTDFFVELYAEPTDKNPADYIEDVSETERTGGGGVVQGCRSSADVSADTNVGGVVGAVTLEIELGREDEGNVSGLLTGGMKYLVYAVVRECSGVGAVYAKKEAAGGVVGRMDFGAVLRCEAAGSAETGGGYAGGIAGYCLGTIRGCLARTRLAAARYVGGVAGLGHDLIDCRCLPQALPETEYAGAVAGDADGRVEGNLYADCAVGAVNGMSFTGQAEPVSYDVLLERSGGSALLGSVTVQFVSADGLFASVEVPYGGRVEKLPAVPDREGGVWVWDDFDNTAITSGQTVYGRYVRPIPTLSDGTELPECLAEGSFREGQRLLLEPYAPNAETPEAVLDARTVRVEDYEGALTLRLRQSADGRLYLADENGALRETDYTRDGSYIVFSMESGGSFVLTEKRAPVWPYFALGGGGAAALGVGLWLLLRARKKKHAAV